MSPLVGRTCAFDAKNRVFFRLYKFVNTYMERDRKIFKSAVFGVQVAALLIEVLTTDFTNLHRFF
jgi:hypothetical protein